MNEKINLDITPKKDIVFKRLFGSKGNEEILKDFLESILDTKIESLTLDLNTEMLPEFYEGKQTRVDVRTKLSDGTEVNIEIQADAKKYSDDRCLQHWSRIYSNTIRKGEEYTSLSKTICIWIIDGKIYEEFEDVDSKWQIMNKKHMLTNHFNKLEFYIIELQKLRDSDKIKPSKKEFWLWFIDHTNEELVRMACDNNDRIKEAREQLDKIRADEELMDRIRLQEEFEWDQNTFLANATAEAKEKGLAEGRVEGEAKGKSEANKETAQRMLKLGADVEFISKATGLSKQEIEKLKNDKCSG